MPPIDYQAYEQRKRAESFGEVATDYDRYRPRYPQQLIDDLVALQPATTLDIGCGTGIAAHLLVTAGLHVLGVEIDEQMAAVARARGLNVEISGFEQWDERGRRFDLITCAQAWHWIDPAIGISKAARLLQPGGTLALFWNYDEIDARSRAVIEGVYERVAPELRQSVATGTERRDEKPYAAALRANGSFASVETRTYRWTRAETVDDFVGRVGTHSDHLVLGPARLRELQVELREALRRSVDEVTLTGGTYTIFAYPR